MNQKYFVFFAICILTFLFSCTKHSNNRIERVKEIDLSKSYNIEHEEFLSLIADTIVYIALETNRNILLGSIRKPWKNVQFTDELIFICDGEQLLSFDYSGKFLFRFGNKGKGPNEYFHIDDFTLLEIYKRVVILNKKRRELLFFDFQGSFIKSVKIDFWPYEITSLNKEFIALENIKGFRKYSDYKTISILDNNYKLQSRLIEQNKEREIEKAKSIAAWSKSSFFSYCDTLSYWEFQYDTIWRIPNKSLAYPAYYINLGKDKLPFKYILDEYVNEDPNIFISTERVLETKKFFFFRIAYKRHLLHIMYSKENNNAECIVHHIKNVPFASFINDIDGGLPFWPEGIMNENKTFSLIYGYELLLKLQGNKAKEVFQPVNNLLMHLSSNAQISDNPIIMIIKMNKK